MDNAGRDKSQNVFYTIYPHSMACIVAALISDNYICLLRIHIYYFSFSFIAPLGTKHC